MGYTNGFAAPTPVPNTTAPLQDPLLNTTTHPEVTPPTGARFIASPHIGYRDGVVFNDSHELLQFMHRFPEYPINPAHLAEFPTRAEAVFYATAPVLPENHDASVCTNPDDISFESTQVLFSYPEHASSMPHATPPSPTIPSTHPSPPPMAHPPVPPMPMMPPMPQMPPMPPMPPHAYHPPPMYHTPHWIPPPAMYPPGYPMSSGYSPGFYPPMSGPPMSMPFYSPPSTPHLSTLKFDKFSGKVIDWPRFAIMVRAKLVPFRLQHLLDSLSRTTLENAWASTTIAAALFQALDSATLTQFSDINEINSHMEKGIEMWHALEVKFNPTTQNEQVDILSELTHAKMTTTETFADYYCRLKNLNNTLLKVDSGMALQDKSLMAIMGRTLDKKRYSPIMEQLTTGAIKYNNLTEMATQLQSYEKSSGILSEVVVGSAKRVETTKNTDTQAPDKGGKKSPTDASPPLIDATNTPMQHRGKDLPSWFKESQLTNDMVFDIKKWFKCPLHRSDDHSFLKCPCLKSYDMKCKERTPDASNTPNASSDATLTTPSLLPMFHLRLRMRLLQASSSSVRALSLLHHYKHLVRNHLLRPSCLVPALTMYLSLLCRSIEILSELMMTTTKNYKKMILQMYPV